MIAAISLASQAYAAIHPLLTPVLALATLHLPDVPPLGHVHELVDEPLAVHLGQDAPLVVVPAGEVSAVHHSSLVELQPVTYDTQVL